MNDLLLARAEQVGGAFTSADARACGVDSNDLTALLRAHEVRRIGPRAYVVTDAWEAASTPEAQHKLVTRAVVRSLQGRVVASHHSAAALLDLPFWKVDTDTVHVTRLKGRSTRRRAGVSIHTAWPGAELGRVRITPLIGPAEAVVGTALANGFEAGVVVADCALHNERTTRDALLTVVTRLSHVPGIALARKVIDLAEPLTESVGETRTRLILQSISDNLVVTPQFPFLEPDGREWARADFLVGDRLVLEFDGRKKYRAAQGKNQKEVEEIVWAEKRREERITGLGYIVFRLVWADLDKPVVVAAKIRDALRRLDQRA